MENEESLMNVLSRLSFSIEQAMKQKRHVEQRLLESTNQVNMLTQANDALMKHVADLEKRNEIVVNGLMKIVNTVDTGCDKIKTEVPEDTEPTSTDEDDTTKINGEKTPCIDAARDGSGTATNTIDDPSSVGQASEAGLKEPEAAVVDLDYEPESAELKSISEHAVAQQPVTLHPIDPLVFSEVMDYAADPDEVFPDCHRRASRGLLSGRLRSGRLRSSRGLFRKRREASHVDGSRSVENRRCRKSGGIRPDDTGMPVPEATCGCFLQSIFGCRH